jgi:tetratricopeptide (TPR) repeat protein
VADFGKAIALDSSKAVYYFNRGSVYNRQKKFRDAIDDLTKAIELGTDTVLAQAYYQRAAANYQLSRNREAVDDLHKCLDLNPDAELKKLAQEALLVLQK